MGKKSRRVKHKGSGGGAAPPAVVASASGATAAAPLRDRQPSAPHPPPDASCWICLDGDPDDEGKPIVRDCSCRGEDAGFAHLSCLVGFAKMKSMELAEAGNWQLIEPWQRCQSCRQHHQRHVALAMARSYLSFVDDETSSYPGMDTRKLEGLNLMITTILAQTEFGNLPELREEGKGAANKVLSITKGAEEKDSDGNFANKGFATLQLLAYTALGKLSAADGTREGKAMSLKYYEKLQDRLASDGNKLDAHGMTNILQQVNNELDGGGGEETKISESSSLRSVREKYEEFNKNPVATTQQKVQYGLLLSRSLIEAGHGLEGERLLNELFAVSRRVHGRDHQLTKDIEARLAVWTKRRVRAATDKTLTLREYYAVRFNPDNEKYVLEDTPPGNRIYELPVECFEMAKGTPVVCHGLKNAAHLNGKIADVQSISVDGGVRRYAVRFENERIKPVLVKPANLHILFDLPDKE